MILPNRYNPGAWVVSNEKWSGCWPMTPVCNFPRYDVLSLVEMHRSGYSGRPSDLDIAPQVLADAHELR